MSAIDYGRVTVLCGPEMEEVRREDYGERWCFRHRRREHFDLVVMAPVDLYSYYGPHTEIRGPRDDCTDLFPGWTREWGDG